MGHFGVMTRGSTSRQSFEPMAFGTGSESTVPRWHWRQRSIRVRRLSTFVTPARASWSLGWPHCAADPCSACRHRAAVATWSRYSIQARVRVLSRTTLHRCTRSGKPAPEPLTGTLAQQARQPTHVGLRHGTARSFGFTRRAALGSLRPMQKRSISSPLVQSSWLNGWNKSLASRSVRARRSCAACRLSICSDSRRRSCSLLLAGSRCSTGVRYCRPMSAPLLRPARKIAYG